MMRLRVVVTHLVAAALCCAVPGSSSADTGLPGPLIDVAVMAPATRGARTQVVPFPSPPMLCVAGSYVHRVETGGVKLVAFTFDDGPWPYATQAIMTTIEQHGGRATFFMIGGLVFKYPALAREVVARGHEIGNHTLNHYRDGYRQSIEIVPYQQQVGAVVGVQPRLFRSPGMVKSALVQSQLARLGMCNFFGNILPGDTILPAKSSSQLCAAFTSQLKPGSIVMLHDGGNHYATVMAMPCMTDYAVRMGYRLVTVSELMSQGYWTT